MKLGVFDSGIGGKAIANHLQKDFPEAEIVYVNDSAHVPYGSRSEAEIIQLTKTAIQPLIEARCAVIVIACNTATAAAIEYLRSTYPNIPFVGLEPMVKPAAETTKSGIVAICATPYTLQSQRYKNLKKAFASNVHIIEPDCSKWAYMIERNEVQKHSIHQTVENVCAQGADVIVLACTHYHWIKEEITKTAAGRAQVIDPSEAISRRVASILGI